MCFTGAAAKISHKPWYKLTNMQRHGIPAWTELLGDIPFGLTTMQRILTLIIVTIALSSFAHGEENWPQFRGPTGQGISDAQKSSAHVQ